MKFSNTLLGVAAFTHGINAVAAPVADAVALDNRAPEPEFEAPSERSTNEELWKRKGGGGGGGRGGGGGGRGSTGSSSSRPAPNSATSNTGGRTTTGSGPPPTYGGGGNYYSGGARAPYGPGTTSSGIAPALLTGAAIGGLGFAGYHYLHGAYSYPYTHHYTFYNATTMMNETKPVVCLCDRYDPCTCEDNGDQAYFKSIIGNGTYDGLNMSIVTVAKDTKTSQSTIYINGGVPNGTTASGGTEDPNAASGMMALAQAAGWWPAAAVAFATAFML